jgi:hypothetical protein
MRSESGRKLAASWPIDFVFPLESSYMWRQQRRRERMRRASP